MLRTDGNTGSLDSLFKDSGISEDLIRTGLNRIKGNKKNLFGDSYEEQRMKTVWTSSILAFQ